VHFELKIALLLTVVLKHFFLLVILNICGNLKFLNSVLANSINHSTVYVLVANNLWGHHFHGFLTVGVVTPIMLVPMQIASDIGAVRCVRVDDLNP